MAERGILCEDERLELWEGEIFRMSPIGNAHAASVDGFNGRLTRRLPEDVVVRIQGPLRLSARSEVQPDVLILRPRADRYFASSVGPEDVLLLIEVSDTTLRYDRTIKLPRYARAGIREVWIVNLKGKRLFVYRDLVDGKYTTQLVLGPADTVAPVEFPDVSIEVAYVLG